MRVGRGGTEGVGADSVAGVGMGVHADVAATRGQVIGAPVDRTLPDPEHAQRNRALYPMLHIGRDSR